MDSSSSTGEGFAASNNARDPSPNASGSKLPASQRTGKKMNTWNLLKKSAMENITKFKKEMSDLEEPEVREAAKFKAVMRKRNITAKKILQLKKDVRSIKTAGRASEFVEAQSTGSMLFGTDSKRDVKKLQTRLIAAWCKGSVTKCFLAWRAYSKSAKKVTSNKALVAHWRNILSQENYVLTPQDISGLLLLLKENKFFKDLPYDLRVQICYNMQWLECDDQDVLFYKRDVGDLFYIIITGSVSIWSKRNEHLLAELGPGQGFGELALINPDGFRNATAVANGHTDMIIVAKEDYLRTIYAMGEVQTREKLQFMCRTPMFRDCALCTLREAVSTLRLESHASGEEMLKQGQPPSDLFFIVAGQVDVVMELDLEENGVVCRRRVQLATLGPGGHFGAESILKKCAQNTTVICRGPTKLLRAQKNDFFSRLDQPTLDGFQVRVAKSPQAELLQRSGLKEGQWTRFRKEVVLEMLPSHPVDMAGPAMDLQGRWKYSERPAPESTKDVSELKGACEMDVKKFFTNDSYVEYLNNACICVIHIDSRDGSWIHTLLLDQIFDLWMGLSFKYHTMALKYTPQCLIAIAHTSRNATPSDSAAALNIQGMVNEVRSAVPAMIKNLNNNLSAKSHQRRRVPKMSNNGVDLPYPVTHTDGPSRPADGRISEERESRISNDDTDTLSPMRSPSNSRPCASRLSFQRPSTSGSDQGHNPEMTIEAMRRLMLARIDRRQSDDSTPDPTNKRRVWTFAKMKAEPGDTLQDLAGITFTGRSFEDSLDQHSTDVVIHAGMAMDSMFVTTVMQPKQLVHRVFGKAPKRAWNLVRQMRRENVWIPMQRKPFLVVHTCSEMKRLLEPGWNFKRIYYCERKGWDARALSVKYRSMTCEMLRHVHSISQDVPTDSQDDDEEPQEVWSSGEARVWSSGEAQVWSSACGLLVALLGAILPNPCT
ncbi:hypothetical protein CYMTET_26661 [Cymbomonas tetramitiformis]|uniref:Cyclic nucleotide-binding domain-containing protein n=1 Tax=Cymbomonas tetramitiformis TaxID=36881 RepID=A0AAE0FRW3_9CHLO|nr:hypothetical protein CYMTET_26661 [Cymbomonas tetramitiformis]